MSQFNPSANVEALLGGYRTGESAVHTGLALAHQRQSNILMSARMAHYEALDEARQRGQDLQQRKLDEKDQADRDTNEALLAIHLDGMRRQQNQQQATRLADTSRTALNFGQPLGGAMIGGAVGTGTVLAPEPSPGMGPSPDEGGAPPVGTNSVLAPPEPAPDTALQSGPGAIAEGAPQQAAPETDEYKELDNRYLPALELARRTGNRVNVAAVLKMFNSEHAALDKRKQNEALDKNRTANTAIRGREADSREATRTARIGQGDRGLDLKERGLDQQADQFGQRIALEKDRFGNTVRHEGVTEAEQKRRQDYLEKTYGSSGNKLDHDLSSLITSGSRDQLRAQLREKSATGGPTKVALRLATMMREAGLDPDEERLLGDKDDADEKYNALKVKPSTGWEASPEFKAQDKAAKALKDYYAKPKPSPAGAKTPRLPTAQELSELNSKYSDKTPEEVQAIWEREHAGGS